MRFLPYDTPGSVRRFLARIRPRAAIIMETELWPNLLHECRPARRAGAVRERAPGAEIRVALSPLCARSFSAGVAQKLAVAAQSAEDAERFIAIGADPARTQVVGNVKFDMQLGEEVAEKRARAARRLPGRASRLDRPAAPMPARRSYCSTAHAELEQAVAGALLVLVPRHPQRFESVAALLERRGLVVRPAQRAARRCARRPKCCCSIPWVSSRRFYAAADIAFVGGSLVPVGGHNLLEPAALGVPVITGPYTQSGPRSRGC